MLTVGKIVEQSEKIAPLSLALPDDPVGLQLGSMAWQVRRLMLALDAGPDTIGQAVDSGADMLLTHHPLIFKPLNKVDFDTMAGKAVALAIENRVAVYSAHTNLDASAHGINRALAGLLGLRNVQVFGSTGPGNLKLVTFVPGEALEPVREALFNAGNGIVRAYSRCSFTNTGEGTFLGSEGTEPAVGQAGRFERAKEARLEIIVARDNLNPTMDALRQAHPYEEPVVDLYSLFTREEETGLGLAGNLNPERTIEDLASDLMAGLGESNARLVGRPSTVVRRAAICAGSGASMLEDKMVLESDLFITGDIRYHDARRAQEAGLALLDIGHFAPECFGIKHFGKMMEKALNHLNETVEIIYADEENPFTPLIGRPLDKMA